MRTLAELSDLDGRCALITGGAGHIAHAVSEALLEKGCDLVISDLNADSLEERRRLLAAGESHHRNIITLDLNLEEPGAPKSLVDETLNRCGRLDIIVNCASYTGATSKEGWHVSFGKQSAEPFMGAVQLSTLVPFLLVQNARSALCASGHGTVILLSSIYGMVGPDMRLYEGTSMSNSAGYHAGKGGLVQLTRYLATVLAPEVRVNAISPGGVRRRQPRQFQERYCDRTPLRRMAIEEDVKGAIAYLASDLSSYVTGHNLVVDGGWTIW